MCAFYLFFLASLPWLEQRWRKRTSLSAPTLGESVQSVTSEYNVSREFFCRSLIRWGKFFSIPSLLNVSSDCSIARGITEMAVLLPLEEGAIVLLSMWRCHSSRKHKLPCVRAQINFVSRSSNSWGFPISIEHLWGVYCSQNLCLQCCLRSAAHFLLEVREHEERVVRKISNINLSIISP